MTHEPECPLVTEDVQGPTYLYECPCDLLRAAYRRGYNDHARSVQHWQDTHGAYRQTEVVIHQCPPEGSGVMPCCGVTPFERMGGRMTLDPALVTCTGSAK